MVMPAGRQKRGLIAQALRDIKSQDITVEIQRPIQVGDLQMNMPNANAGMKRTPVIRRTLGHHRRSGLEILTNWERSDSNREPRDYESPALTVELRSRATLRNLHCQASCHFTSPPTIVITARPFTFHRSNGQLRLLLRNFFLSIVHSKSGSMIVTSASAPIAS